MDAIKLDSTLYELYGLDGGRSQDVVLAYATPLADITLSEGIPAPLRFAYQSPLIPSDDRDYLAREFLHLLPQLFAFIAGKMPVVLFKLDGSPEHMENGTSLRFSHDQYQHDAANVYERLVPEQRPEVSFVTRPKDIKFASNTKFAIINPMDCFDVLPQLCSAEGHYELLSKTNLAHSGLPTPPTTAIETKYSVEDLANPDVLNAEVKRFVASIETRPSPFIVKLPQSLAGQGTFIVRTEDDRELALKVLRPEIRRMLSSIRPDNADLKPASLVLQEMVPGEAVALSLFVTQEGRAVFNACCHQLIDNEGKWGGNYVDYRAQDELAAKYADIASQLARHTRSKGYWGPFGADIMTDAQGQQLVIDMNVRVIGSHPLGALRGFFQQRGLNVAICFFPVIIKGTKDEFAAGFKREFDAGELVVGGWVHLKDQKTSMATLVLAARDKESLQPLIARLDEWKTEIPGARK